MGSVPVADLLSRLLLMEGGQGQPSCFLGNKHVLCWGYEDMLSAMEKDRIAKGVGDHERGGLTLSVTKEVVLVKLVWTLDNCS